MGIDERTIDNKLKSGEKLGQCIWVEIKWSRETKSREKEIGELTNLKYLTTVTRRVTPVGIDEGNVSVEMTNATGPKSNGWERRN